jgi:uncharacterized membrane protein YqaE (UPF0057 family)
MPDKTHYDLETLILMVMAMLNPMIAVFMMKGFGKEYIICFLLLLLMLVFLVSCLFLTYLLIHNVLGSFQLGSTPTPLSPIVTRGRSPASLWSLQFLHSRLDPMSFRCRGPILHPILLSRPLSTGLNQNLHPRLRLHLQPKLQKWLWSRKHLTRHLQLHLHLPLQSELELWKMIDDTTTYERYLL